MLSIRIVNDGKGTKEIANYNYAVYINKTIIAHGRINNFNRKLGWKKLVQRMINDKEMIDYKEIFYTQILMENEK